jgi:hypothetical protein
VGCCGGETVTLPFDIELSFPVMTAAGFPHGLRCATCSRLITEGQPYQEDPVAIYDDGTTLCVLRCVYCPTGDQTEWPD